ncbi:MAG: acyltransferase [Clostridia bacterium]|nr:acyltransferase [Clostridia bacterium]
MKKDIALDHIRAFGMLCIFFCHIFLVQDNYVPAFWLNTGVQIFIILSATLSAKVDFHDAKSVLDYLIRRFLRIFIPLWIYLCAIILILSLIGIEISPITAILFFTGCAGYAKNNILGLGHMWYITVQLICYLLVPILYYLHRLILSKGKITLCLISLFSYVTFVLLFYLTGHAEYGVSIFLFCFSYMLARRGDGEKLSPTRLFLFSAPPALLLCIVRIVLDLNGIESSTLYMLYDSVFITTVRAFLGFALYFGLYIIFSREALMKFPVSKGISKLSYEIFITHQFIILSVAKYIPYCSGTTVISYLLLALCSALLTVLNSLILHWATIGVRALSNAGINAIRKRGLE